MTTSLTPKLQKCEIEPFTHLPLSPYLDDVYNLPEIGSTTYCMPPDTAMPFLPKNNYTRDNEEPVALVKLLKFRLAVSEDMVDIEAYVHFLETNRTLDLWISFSHIILDCKRIYKDGEPLDHSNSNRRNMIKLQKKEKKITSSTASIDALECEREKITNIKFISHVIFDGYKLIPDYFSPYPMINPHADKLFICKNSLRFFFTYKEYMKNRSKKLDLPKGSQLIYAKF